MPTHAQTATPTLTIAVLTMNEAHQIERCLRSAAFADELIVVDSGSTDDTVAIAQRIGAKTFVYPDWQGFAVQRNRQLEHATGDYILFLDADEEITPNLQAEIKQAIGTGISGVWETIWTEVAYGRELKYILSRKSLGRLFRRSLLLRFEGVVHEHAVLREPDAPRRVLRQHLLHYSRQTIHGSLKKLTQYAMLGATKRAQMGKRGGVLRGLASAFAMFFRLYILRLAFTGGGPGFLYSFFIALECFFRYAALHYDRPYLTSDVGR